VDDKRSCSIDPIAESKAHYVCSTIIILVVEISKHIMPEVAVYYGVLLLPGNIFFLKG